MVEEIFDENFPSLVGHYMQSNGVKFRNEKTIEKYCIDKQNIISTLNHWLQDIPKMRDAIKDELGL